MRPQVFASCANCWFNALQHGSVGLPVGYCSEHRVVLRRSDETTCGRQIRKDLLLNSAKEFQHHHFELFQDRDHVINLSDREPVSNGEFIEEDSSFIRNDAVADVVADYGEYDTKIESLAQLRSLGTIRSEFAMLSLGRAYTDRCITRGGTWTSGLHLFWWTKRRLIESEVPEPSPADFRYSAASSLKRQIELSVWSLLMFRLTFVSDVGSHAENSGDPIRELSTIAEQAALDTEVPSKRKLLSWIKNVGKPLLENAMPEARYRTITGQLRSP